MCLAASFTAYWICLQQIELLDGTSLRSFAEIPAAAMTALTCLSSGMVMMASLVRTLVRPRVLYSRTLAFQLSCLDFAVLWYLDVDKMSKLPLDQRIVYRRCGGSGFSTSHSGSTKSMTFPMRCNAIGLALSCELAQSWIWVQSSLLLRCCKTPACLDCLASASPVLSVAGSSLTRFPP